VVYDKQTGSQMMWSHAIFRDSPIPQLVLDTSGRVQMANPAAQALAGGRPLNGVVLDGLVDPTDRPAVAAFVAALAGLPPGTSRALARIQLTCHGTRRSVGLHGSASREGGDPLMLVVTVEDAPEAGDGLTRVPGRQAGMAMLADAVAPEAPGCVLAIDLDAFEELNAEFGFDAGDVVLAMVADRLRTTVPPGTHLARIDGDMFLVVVPGIPLGHASTLAGQLLGAVVAPIEVEGTPKVVTASIGGAGLAMPTRDRALAAALRALALAKDRGGAQVVIDNPQEPRRGRRRRDLEDELRRAEDEAAMARLEARTDPLTGLANRRRLDEDRQLLQERARATEQWVAAVYVDLDEFGSINRARGDDAGDHALAAVARIMADQLRAEDNVYRKGGEEFVVLLTDADLAGAHGAAERLRIAVQQAQIPHGGTPERTVVTISCGVAAGRGPHLDLWRLTRQANDAMRLAKGMGRNRTAFLVGPPDEPQPHDDQPLPQHDQPQPHDDQPQPHDDQPHEGQGA
jgi:diguanylate cyclase (GGDEF)-like protein